VIAYKTERSSPSSDDPFTPPQLASVGVVLLVVIAVARAFVVEAVVIPAP